MEELNPQKYGSMSYVLRISTIKVDLQQPAEHRLFSEIWEM
jgi:hypothetical protein